MNCRAIDHSTDSHRQIRPGLQVSEVELMTSMSVNQMRRTFLCNMRPPERYGENLVQKKSDDTLLDPNVTSTFANRLLLHRKNKV